MDSSQKKLELLQKELTNTAVVLKVASQRLLGTKATRHPIFIAHTDGKISYGIEIIDGDEHGLKWSIRLATTSFKSLSRISPARTGSKFSKMSSA